MDHEKLLEILANDDHDSKALTTEPSDRRPERSGADACIRIRGGPGGAPSAKGGYAAPNAGNSSSVTARRKTSPSRVMRQDCPTLRLVARGGDIKDLAHEAR